ncbi:MAG: M67 family metallopeptidase [Oscillatoriales cyanobacterium C42_A2020_001]|nr:M67 family metallopeptidase [Leptolyngbyaceae cyanobacterium C42_A2020_001]
MSLILCADHLQAMRSHAEQAYPNECCGLMLGRLGQQPMKHVVAVRAVENAWDENTPHELQTRDLDDGLSCSKSHRYWVNPQEMLTVMREARNCGLEIIGIYHSHPDQAAVPSECDRRLAWQHYSYVIISVQQGTAQDLQSWHLNEAHQFQPEAIEFATLPTKSATCSTLPFP